MTGDELQKTVVFSNGRNSQSDAQEQTPSYKTRISPKPPVAFLTLEECVANMGVLFSRE